MLTEVLALDDTLFDGTLNALSGFPFVAVVAGTIEETVACFDGVVYGISTSRFGDLIYRVELSVIMISCMYPCPHLPESETTIAITRKLHNQYSTPKDRKTHPTNGIYYQINPIC